MYDSKAAEFWKNNEALATSLIVLLADRYDWDIVNYTPHTIRALIKHDTDVDISDGNLDRIMAGLSILRAPDHFYRNAADFEFLCRMLSSDDRWARPKFGELAEIHDVCWGALEAELLGAKEEEDDWSQDIKLYVKTLLKHSGFATPPDLLKILKLADDVYPLEDHGDDETVKRMYETGRNAISNELNSWIVDRLKLLSSQLETLPVKEFETKKAVERIKQLIPEDKQ